MAKLGKKAKETKEAAAQQIPENEATPAEQAAAVQQLAAPLPSKLELTSPQKAAAVIVSLGADKASQLYKYMEPEDVEQLTVEVAKLGFLDSNQTEDVLNEFLQMCMTNKAVTEGGLEYAKTVLEKAFGRQRKIF